MDLILDIETRRNPKLPPALLSDLLDNIVPDGRLTDPAKIEADIEKKRKAIESKFALSPLTGSIIGFSFAVDKMPIQSFFDLENELSVLEKLSKVMSNHNYVFDRIVGFNIKGFDLPYIMVRAAQHGVNFRKLTWSKYQQEYGVFDVALHLNGFESFGYISLQRWAMLFGILAEPYESGADIEELVLAGDVDTIKAKCERDVNITREIYKLILPTLGEWGRGIVALDKSAEEVHDLIKGGMSEEEREAIKNTPPPPTQAELFMRTLDLE